MVERYWDYKWFIDHKYNLDPFSPYEDFYNSDQKDVFYWLWLDAEEKAEKTLYENQKFVTEAISTVEDHLEVWGEIPADKWISNPYWNEVN